MIILAASYHKPIVDMFSEKGPGFRSQINEISDQIWLHSKIHKPKLKTKGIPKNSAI